MEVDDDSWINSSNSLFIMPTRPYYELKMFVAPECSELKQLYIDACSKYNNDTLSVITGSSKYFDSGFDLFCPEKISIEPRSLNLIIKFVAACRGLNLRNPLALNLLMDSMF